MTVERTGPTMNGKYPMPDAADIRLADVLRALGDAGRVRILEVLSDDEPHAISAEELGLDLTKSTISHHLKTMREAGITETAIDGRTCSIRLRRADLDSRFPGLVAALTSSKALADLRA